MFNLRTTAMALFLLGATGCGGAATAVPLADGSAGPPGEGAASAGSMPKEDPATNTKDPRGSGAPAPANAETPGSGAAPQSAGTEGQALGGTLSKKEIHAIVTKHSELFDECYTIGAGKSKQFVATVTVKATIGPSGIVNEAKVVSSNAKNAKVDQCVAEAFEQIKFPPPNSGATSVISFPMEFQGLEEVIP